MKKNLTIICVGYNEEVNLPKFFKSLEIAKEFLDIKIYYIDQSSNDKSVEIAKKFTNNIIIRENKGYADPDKMWAVNELIGDNELTMILDADEEVTYDIAKEISLRDFNVGFTSRKMFFMGKVIQISCEPRIFYKKYIEITDKIHDYLHLGKDETNIIKLKNFLINNDKKNDGKEISIFIEKLNKYTDSERRSFSSLKIIIMMLIMPLIYFFGYGIRHKNFLRGTPGFIFSILQGFYQFIAYAKIYEKKYLNNNKD